MKINLPDGQKPSKKDSKKDTDKRIRWRKRGDCIAAVIGNKYVKIDLKTFDVLLPNGFKITAKSVQDAKEKAMKFFKN